MVDMGDGLHKQICSGIQSIYTEEELLHRKVVAYNNIKPCKMAGEASQAMILAGEFDHNGPNENCQLLEFEGGGEDIALGTRITIEGVLDPVGEEADTASLKSIGKEWQKVQPLFNIEDDYAFFGNHQWKVN